VDKVGQLINAIGIIAIATDISEQKLQKAYDEAQSAFP